MLRIIFLFFVMVFVACSNKKGEENKTPARFDKKLWAIQDGVDHPYRDAMVMDLISDKKLTGLKEDSLLKLIGPPNRSDTNYRFYIVKQKRWGMWPISTKSLVIELNEDSTVRTARIKQ